MAPALATIKTEDGTWLSLEKLVGVPIKEVSGYITSEFGVYTFKLVAITFADGSKVWVEGEHDMPYLPSSEKVPNFDEATLEALYEEGETEDDEVDQA